MMRPWSKHAATTGGRQWTDPGDEMTSAFAIRSFQREIIRIAARQLGRELTAKEKEFVTSRHGFVALEMIHDTVCAGSAAEVEQYLNSE